MKNWPILLLAASAMTLGSCNRSADVRFKMSVKIIDIGKPRTFDRVWRLHLSQAPVALAAPYNGKFTAEAVAIPISGRPTLYALTMGGKRNGPVRGSLGNLPEIVFDPLVPKSVPHGDRLAVMQAIAGMQGQSRTLSCEPPDESLCPIFAYFDNESDPSTLHVVDPKNLPAQYRGIRISSISITIVDDAPSKLSPALPAFRRDAGWSQWYRKVDNNDPRKLSPEAFRSDM